MRTWFRPQGLIQPKGSISVLTFRARPWKLTPRLTVMPMLPSLSPSSQTPRLAGSVPASMPQSTGRKDHGLFEAGDEVNDLQAPAIEVDDRIDHQLTRPVVGDVAPPVRGHHRHAFFGSGTRR